MDQQRGGSRVNVGAAALEVDSSSVSNNFTGFATTGGVIRISRTVIYDNVANYAISAAGKIATSSDNKVAVNGSTVPDATIIHEIAIAAF